jgi:hypothetical protein
MAFNNAGHGNAEGQEGVEKKGGKVVASVVYEPNRPSYRTELQQILAAKPDVIVTGSYVPDSTIILREWYQSGQDAKWILPGWAANPDLIKALGNEVVEGVISVDSVSNENAPSYKALDAAYMKAMASRSPATSTPLTRHDHLPGAGDGSRRPERDGGADRELARFPIRRRQGVLFAEGKKLLFEKRRSTMSCCRASRFRPVRRCHAGLRVPRRKGPAGPPRRRLDLPMGFPLPRTGTSEYHPLPGRGIEGEGGSIAVRHSCCIAPASPPVLPGGEGACVLSCGAN